MSAKVKKPKKRERMQIPVALAVPLSGICQDAVVGEGGVAVGVGGKGCGKDLTFDSSA